jgi:hypothetical protein
MGNGHHLEQFPHLSFAFAGKAIDGRLDDLLGVRLAVAAERGGAFEDAEADQEVALVQQPR